MPGLRQSLRINEACLQSVKLADGITHDVAG
jgi:hypothetical protein